MTIRAVSSTTIPRLSLPLSLLWAGALLTACIQGTGISDPPRMLPDAGVPDARPDEPLDGGSPVPCLSSLSVSCSPFPLPEGGEFRLERYQYDPQGTDDLAAQAFFFSGQTPPFRSFAGIDVPLRRELVEQGYACGDYRSGDSFDNGSSPQAQAVVDTREYLDVGATARLANLANPSDAIYLEKRLASEDPAAATDLSSNLVHDILYRGDPATVVTPRARYAPAIEGSVEYPALDLKYGQSSAGDELADPYGNGTPQIYMPGRFTMTAPAEADFYGPKSLIFTRGLDTVFYYTLSDPEPVGQPGGYPTIIPFIGFVDDEGKINAYCFKVTPGTLDDGEFIVPHEVLDLIPPAPTTGYVLFGRFTHAAWESQRVPVSRMDLLGADIRISQQWEVRDAP